MAPIEICLGSVAIASDNVVGVEFHDLVEKTKGFPLGQGREHLLGAKPSLAGAAHRSIFPPRERSEGFG